MVRAGLGTGRKIGQGPLPFDCFADWSAVLPTTDWSVRCTTVDP